MQLQPRRPRGRSNRKALRYAHEVRRLRAAGHTLESIREALLDLGVSVSLSTVRREASRPPSQWEMVHAEEVSFALVELPSTAATGDATPWPPRLGADIGQSVSPASAESGNPSIEAVDVRRSFGLFSRVFGVLRRLRHSQPIP